MTDDVLRLLRDANPEPGHVGYSDDEIPRRIADIRATADASAIRVSDTTGEAQGTRRVLLPALAAAVVVAVAGGSTILLSRDHGSTDPAGTSGHPVTCAVSTAGGADATRDREARAVAVITTRTTELGGAARSFASDPSNGSVKFTAEGISSARGVHACRVSTSSIRTVVTSPVPADTSSPRSADPLATLKFTLPDTEAAYARLDPGQRTELATAMSHYNCAGASATATSGALMCQDSNDATRVYLLGPELIGATDIQAATVASSAERNNTGEGPWLVDLQLREAAVSRIGDYTQLHHTDDPAADPATCGPTGTTSCQDYLAFTVDNEVISVPVSLTPLTLDLLVVGIDLDRGSARALAADYTAASIQLRPAA